MRILILTALLATGCGNLIGKPNTATSTSTSTAVGNLQIVSFSPASQTLAATPTSVVITFNESNLNIVAATTASNYNLTCNATSAAATSASYGYGSNSVTVTLPALSATAGDTCSLIVSLAVTDTTGAFIGGGREADYFMSASSSAFSWAESTTVSYTSAMGGAGGSPFNDAGSDGMALSGLNLNVNSLIAGVDGAWSTASGAVSYGGVHGTAPTATTMVCPGGYRMTGIYGYYGTYLEAVGIYCKNATQTLSYTSPLQGTATGSSFSLACNAGQFATSLYGNAGAYVDSLGLGCR